jgi:hypothetical protein
MKRWYCDQCAVEKGAENSLVDDPKSRYVISEDALQADGTRRAYRIRLMNLCGVHMRERLDKARPAEISGQEAFWMEMRKTDG